MIRNQFTLDLNEELIIDNFAGGGGASIGIEMALGRRVDHAINHDLHALGMHRINHPQTVHHCEDVFDVDPRAITQGRRVGLCHNSPDCKHFSKAKGGKPLDKRIRGLVLVILRWCMEASPRVITMENVEEIITWAPLKKIKKGESWGWYPDPALKGRTWLAFLSCLSTGIDPDHPDLPEFLTVLCGDETDAENNDQAAKITAEKRRYEAALVRGFGYQYEARVIRACDHGTPTIRKRLFMVARRDSRPIIWPEPTHFDANKRIPRGGKGWLPIADCLDWSLQCPSIFLTREEARTYRCKRPLVKSTLKRIATGVDRYVLRSNRPFLVSLTHQGGDRVEGIDEPGKTITGARRGEKALVGPVLQKFHGSHAGRTDGEPRNYPVTDPLLVQDTEPRFALTETSLAPFLTEHANASAQRTFPADEPMRTQCGEVKGGHFAAITGTLVGSGGPTYSGKPKPLDAPMNAQTTENHAALVSASMVKLRGTNVGDAADAPMHTASAGGTHHGVVAASLIRQFGESIGQAVDTAGPTVMPGGQGKTAALAAFLAQHNGGFNENPGHPADGPARTISSKGSQQQLTALSMAAYYGSERDGQGVDEPMRAATTKARLSPVESILACNLTEEQIAGAIRVAAFLRDYGVEFEGPFATITVDGQLWIIVDIGMRMLTPRELFRAQGFPESYVIERAWLIDPKTGAIDEVTLTKEQQIRMCGNSVCPPVMAALVAANVPELATWYRGEKPKSLALV